MLPDHGYIIDVPKKRFTAEQYEIGLLYLFMIAGGLWHVLNVLQTAMHLLAAPMIILVAVWATFRYDQRLRTGQTDNAVDELALFPYNLAKLSTPSRFHIWSAFVLIFCFGLEYVGVKTGVIFGRYFYTDALTPLFNGVPLAIGFAWLGMLLCSFGIVQRMTTLQTSIWLRSLLLATCMAIFDTFMEPVAVKLDYWQWLEPTGNTFFVAPFKNYAVWFLTSYVLGFAAMKWKLFAAPMPRFAFHAYWAQLLYFTMVALGK
jgi:Carotenoid biosynthesis protein